MIFGCIIFMEVSNIGKLYIVATPIGNLEDITIRAIKTLRMVDIIAAEDTRTASKLCNRYSIKGKIISYHAHNEKRASRELIKELKDGKNVALISESGTPCISDPGNYLLRETIGEKIDIEVLPGPTAFVPALLYSGFRSSRFIFEGFVPASGQNRRKRLREIKDEERTIIYYESPHRFMDFLKDIDKLLGARQVAVIREISKIYEEVIRGTAKELIEYFDERGIKGEVVVVIERKERVSQEDMIKYLKI